MRRHEGIPFTMLLASVIAIAAAACEERAATKAATQTTAAEVGPCRDASEWQQRHGTSCICCHSEFGVAGSIAHDAGVSHVLITDKNGRELEIAPNPFDNFFRHQKMTPPLRAQIVFDDGEVRSMSAPAPHGSCNACHGENAKQLGER